MDQNKNTEGQHPQGPPNQDQRQGSRSNQSWNDQPKPASTPTRDQAEGSREQTRGTGSQEERNRSSSDDDSFEQSER